MIRQKKSQRLKDKSEANVDIDIGKIKLLINSELTEEQLYYRRNHGFELNIMIGDKNYREAYNLIITDFLNKKFEKNIVEELRRI